MTIQEFITKHHIRMQSDCADTNPLMVQSTKADREWMGSASHYKCTFTYGRKRLTTYFSMGIAHTRGPSAHDVLDAIASDCASVENAKDFENFAADLGYDPDSRTAEHIYQTCQRQAKKLQQFLGDDLYQTLLWETERR